MTDTYWRCPYCLRPTAIDPEPGCCGETHAEPIPADEIADYDEHDLLRRAPLTGSTGS